MASKKKGQLAKPPQWWKHLRPYWRRVMWKRERQLGKDEILEALCSVEIPFGTNEAARRGFVMALNEDGSINPEKLEQYYQQKQVNDNRFYEWQIESYGRMLEAIEKAREKEE